MDSNYLLTLLKEIDLATQKEQRSLKGYLERLVENIIKLQYWELETGRTYKYWQTAVFNSRNSIIRLLKRSPSLRRYMEQIYPEIYQNAVKIGSFDFYIPEDTEIELEKILDRSYFG